MKKFSFLLLLSISPGLSLAQTATWILQKHNGAFGTTWPAGSDYDSSARYDYWNQTVNFYAKDNANTIYANSMWLYSPATNTFTKQWTSGTTTLTCTGTDTETLPADRHPYGNVWYDWRTAHYGFFDGACSGQPRSDVYWYESIVGNMPRAAIRRLVGLSDPQFRYEGSAAFDPVGNYAVLFAGDNNLGTCCAGDTWFYSAPANAWKLQQLKTSPPPRSGHATVYDSYNHQILIFSGFSANSGSPDACPNHPTQDLWALPTGSAAWIQPATSGAPPPAHDYWYGRVAEDSNRHRIWFYDTTGSLYYLDELAMTWVHPPSSGGPQMDDYQNPGTCNITGDPGSSDSLVHDPVGDQLIFFQHTSAGGVNVHTLALAAAFPLNPPPCGSGYSTSSSALLLPPPLAYPKKIGAIYRDPLGACVERITTAANTPAAGVDNPVPVYSQNQAWNADKSKILLVNGKIISAANFSTVCANVNDTMGEPVWSAVDPNILWGISGLSILKFSVKSCSAAIEHTFREYAGLEEQGTCPSARKVGWHDQDLAGRYLVKNGCKADGTQEVFWYDVINHVKSPTVISGKPPKSDCPLVNGVSDVLVDPSGKWVILGWGTNSSSNTNKPNANGTGCGVWAFSLDFTTTAEQIAFGHDHSDIAQTPDGNVWWVSFAAQGDNWNGRYPNGAIVKCAIPGSYPKNCSLVYAMTTPPDSQGVGGHLSCHDYPTTYCIESDYENYVNNRIYDKWRPLKNEIVQVGLFTTPTLSAGDIRRLAHARSAPWFFENATVPQCYEEQFAFSYWAQPHATIRQDGEQVLFGSSFGPACRAETYLIPSGVSDPAGASPPSAAP